MTGVDVALLPVSGVYVMTAQEAAEAARRIQPRVAVPMHWGEHIGARADASEFAERAPVEVQDPRQVGRLRPSPPYRSPGGLRAARGILPSLCEVLAPYEGSRGARWQSGP